MDLTKLSEATQGFTGADIENIVDAALKRAFNDGQREPTIEDFLNVIQDTLPLSAMMKDKIAEMRNWAKTRARPASSTLEEVPVPIEEEFGRRRQIEL